MSVHTPLSTQSGFIYYFRCVNKQQVNGKLTTSIVNRFHYISNKKTIMRNDKNSKTLKFLSDTFRTNLIWKCMCHQASSVPKARDFLIVFERSNFYFCTNCTSLPSKKNKKKSTRWEESQVRYLWVSTGRSDSVFYVCRKHSYVFVNMSSVCSATWTVTAIYTNESEYANMPDTNIKNTLLLILDLNLTWA